MTVKELTEHLLRLDPDIEIVVNGYEDGFDPVANLHQKFIRPNSNPKWYYGKYEEGTGKKSKLALLISRH
jgi:hypothetical protein